MDVRVSLVASAAMTFLALSGCLEPTTIVCDSKNLCPKGLRCVTVDAQRLNNNMCVSDACGDGVVDKDEQCDEGNETKYCNRDCTYARCGDGKQNLHANEACDSGDGGVPTDSASCNADCSLVDCGDGKVNQRAGEQCDEGWDPEREAPLETRSCNFNCKVARCGDHLVNSAAGETCDDGQGGEPKETSTCNADCTKAGCGDGKVNHAAGEACDDGVDGGPRDSERCNADCSFAQCGDKYTSTYRFPSGERLEECDDGEATDRCSAKCQWRKCGDGVVDKAYGIEECDESGDAETCNGNDARVVGAACKLVRCGDGYTNLKAHEECDQGPGDDGKSKETTDCDTDCSFRSCGDGLVNHAALEECDDGQDGGPMETRTCNGDCTIARCGDGKTNTTAGEECDDANADEHDDCLSTCRWNRCGDGFLHGAGSRGREVCDQGSRNGAAGCEYGTTCELCSSDCSAVDAGVGPSCGDGLVNGPERCDHGEANGCGACSADCASVVVPAAATGRLTPGARSELLEGETFTLDDGVNAPVVFAFDVTGAGVAPRRAGVDVRSATTAVEVGEAMGRAIASARARLRLRATVEPDSGVVALRNEYPGYAGNTSILETVSGGGFSAVGMAGGLAHGCRGGTGCKEDADCVVGTTCRENQCRATTFRLAVGRAEDGGAHGEVTADVGAVECGAHCADEYPAGSLVALTATPDPKSVFSGWAGACNGLGVCDVLMSRDTNVEAQFVPVVLSVTKHGTGRVTSTDHQIDCGGEAPCSATFIRDSEVTLVGTPGPHARLGEWSGDCADAGASSSCTLVMSGPKAVTVTFTPLESYQLQVQTLGSGVGTVTSEAGEIECGALCTAAFDEGSMVVLTATPDAGSTFVAWGDDCADAGSESTCRITMDGPRSATAAFEVVP